MNSDTGENTQQMVLRGNRQQRRFFHYELEHPDGSLEPQGEKQCGMNQPGLRQWTASDIVEKEEEQGGTRVFREYMKEGGWKHKPSKDLGNPTKFYRKGVAKEDEKEGITFFRSYRDIYLQYKTDDFTAEKILERGDEAANKCIGEAINSQKLSQKVAPMESNSIELNTETTSMPSSSFSIPIASAANSELSVENLPIEEALRLATSNGASNDAADQGKPSASVSKTSSSKENCTNAVLHVATNNPPHQGVGREGHGDTPAKLPQSKLIGRLRRLERELCQQIEGNLPERVAHLERECGVVPDAGSLLHERIATLEAEILP